jgi:putative transposase
MEVIRFSHNDTFKIIGSDLYDSGIYRVVLDIPDEKRVGVIRIDNDGQNSHGGRRIGAGNKRKKKAPLPFLTKLDFLDRDQLICLEREKLLYFLEIEYSVRTLFGELDEKDKKLFDKRKLVMQEVLNLDGLKDEILVHRSVASILKRAMKAHGVSKNFAYKCFSLLVRFGFDAKSLTPRFSNCGAPGVLRPCEPGGRKKAGRKTNHERLSMHAGGLPKYVQPGMRTAWAEMILAADSTIRSPKPSYPIRAEKILRSSFFKKYTFNTKGELAEVKPELGTYPNIKQIVRVLKRDITRINRIIEKTTKSHFTRSQRGSRGHNWEGVSGPGHTWEIDSTIGDIYLRSSINRAWIIGRPIVYVIVDVWSTAVVGFFVALSGPSWEMASTSIFQAAIGEAFKAELWGREPRQVLFPEPTLCASLRTDRGEYLSVNERTTALDLTFMTEINPAYRPDLKGLVEVLHRIGKDKQYHFVPGAIDARRKEFDLKKFRPEQSALTLPEYVLYLESVFREYNLKANRSHRLDVHMKAQGVTPTPAGLWAWGHAVGIGYEKNHLQSSLITKLLPRSECKVTGKGLMFGGNFYESPEIELTELTTVAKADGNIIMPCHYFPGPVKNIWVPHPHGQGVLRLDISEFSNASNDCTWDEVVDTHVYDTTKNPIREHQRIMDAMREQELQEQIIEEAKKATAAAIEEDAGNDKPTMTEARDVERAESGPTTEAETDETSTFDQVFASDSDIAIQTHLAMLSDLLPEVSGGN